MAAHSVITFSSDEEANDGDDVDIATRVPNDRRRPRHGNAAAANSSSLREMRSNRRLGRAVVGNSKDVAPSEVIRRIDLIVMQCIQALDDGRVPVLRGIVGPANHADDDDDDNDDDETDVDNEAQGGRVVRSETRDDDSDDASMSDGEEDPNNLQRGGGRRRCGRAPRTMDAERDETALTVGQTSMARPLVKRITLQQCRSYTSLVLVLSYCHQLLLSRRTTTLREVYYAFVTHFRNQAECNASVQQASRLLGVPRHALGLKASPRGWFCGDVQFEDWTTGAVVLDGRAGNSQGHAVTSEWLEGYIGDERDEDDEKEGEADERGNRRRPYRLRTCGASCVVLIEKEGVYQRLVEDELHVKHPCILVTSRGFPDFATRAFVSALQADLDLPVYGLCDCNPYGVSVLNTFCHGNSNTGNGDSDATFVQWMGLRTSQVEAIRNELPAAVFQAMTPGDVNRLQSIRNDESSTSWLHSTLLSPLEREQRKNEMDLMLELGYKVELEALHWLGMEYLTNLVSKMLRRQHGTVVAESPGALQNGNGHDEMQFESDEETATGDNDEATDGSLLDVI